MTGFDVAGKHVGDGSPCFVIGEIAQAHEGSLTLAHALLDVVADAGCDAVKMQCHIAAAESTPDEPWRVAPKWLQDPSRYHYWRRLEFGRDHWIDLKAHAIERGLAFIVSPFSVEAVKLTEGIADAWKVASGEVNNGLLLAHMTRKDDTRPLFLSTGMSRYREIDQARMYARAGVAVLQCTSEYPCPPERLGLNQIRRLAMDCPTGLSDHSGTIYAGLSAVAQGCDVLEVHATLSKLSQGFDTESSLDPAQLRQLVEGVRWIERAKAHPVDKDAMARELEPMRELFLRKHERKALERSRS